VLADAIHQWNEKETQGEREKSHGEFAGASDVSAARLFRARWMLTPSSYQML
jgi:hypothetical protein